MKKVNTVIIFSAFAILIILFAFWGNTNSSKTASGNVPCLVPNLDVVTHIHPELVIEIDGKNKTIPADVGLRGACERAIHMHDSTGVIHVESQIARDYTLGNFFSVWNEKIEKENYKLTMTVDGKDSLEFGKLILKDKQKIKLIYTKIKK